MECQLVLDSIDIAPQSPVIYLPNEKIACLICKADTPLSEGILAADGNFYCCDDCAHDDDQVKCEGCGDWHNEDDCKEAGDCLYCKTCFDESYYHCSVCNFACSNEDTYSDDAGNPICESCYCDHYGSCSECGNIFSQEDMTCDDTGCYCGECMQSSGEKEDYHSHNETYNCVGKVKWGVELEYSDTDRAEFPYFENGTDHCGAELRSGIMYGDGGLWAVRELSDYAERNGWEADEDCGYHLHLDCRGLSVDQLKSVAYAYYKANKIWAALVDPARLSNSYCHPIYPSRRDLDRITTRFDFICWANSLTRYRFVNWRAYDKHGTVEIRGHEGTVSSNKVCNWIAAHTRFFDYVKDLSFEEIDSIFSNVVRKDFAKFVDIVGENVGKFYSDQVEKRGCRTSVIKNRFAPLMVA